MILRQIATITLCLAWTAPAYGTPSSRLATLDELERGERARLHELVPEIEKTDDYFQLVGAIDQIRHTNVLPIATRQELLSVLRDRQVLLLSRAAGAAIAREDFEEARERLVQASNALHEVQGESQHRQALAQIQVRYIQATCHEVGRELLQDDLGRADMWLSRGELMRGSLAIERGPLAQRADSHLKRAARLVQEHKLNDALARAKSAESQGNFRLALFLYEDAQNHGAPTRDHIQRVLERRREPWLEAGASALVPGLGQFLSGRPGAGTAFLASTAATAALGIWLHGEAAERRERYHDTRDGGSGDLGKRRNAYVLHSVGAYGTLGAALLLYLWNVYDAYDNARDFNASHLSVPPGTQP